MAVYDSYHRPKMVIHEVSADEVSSGVANIQFFNNPQNTNELGFVLKIVDVSGVTRTDGFKCDYQNASGVVSILNDTISLWPGDVVTVIGMSYV